MRPYIQLQLLLSLFVLCDGRRIIDLTHTFDGNVTKYPLASFGISSDFEYYKLWTISSEYHGDMWVSFKYIESYEHQGTHIDAPVHFGAGRQEMHEIPPERLMGPGVVIDVKSKVKNNVNYGVTKADLLEYEEEYGRIPPNAIVMMNSGWAMKYPNANLVFGTETPDNISTFNFPGWRLDACEFLLNERQVSVVGVDTPSTDPAKPDPDPYGGGYPCHVYLQPNNVPLLEYVANLDAVPKNGTTMFLGSIKTRGGTGGPTRIFAVVEDGSCTVTGMAVSTMKTRFSVMRFISIILFIALTQM